MASMWTPRTYVPNHPVAVTTLRSPSDFVLCGMSQLGHVIAASWRASVLELHSSDLQPSIRIGRSVSVLAWPPSFRHCLRGPMPLPWLPSFPVLRSRASAERKAIDPRPAAACYSSMT